MNGIADVEAFLDERVDAGDIPGAAYAVAGREGLLAGGAVGRAAAVPEPVEAREDTIYDLASLTKPLVTSFLFLALRKQLDLSPDAPARRYLPEIERLDKRDITLRHLLTHTSGLPAWVPLYLKGRAISEYLLQVRDIEPESPAGSQVIYSCIGHIMLAEILQRTATAPLDELAQEIIVAPLGLASTGFRPPEAWLDRVAATEDSCQYERRLVGPDGDGFEGFGRGIVRGEVHDRNAWALGGIAGNAGLFSTAEETTRLALEFLGAGSGLLDQEAVRLAQTDHTSGLAEARSFAFRIASRGETAAGPDLPPESFGHNGFTGTSVWIDPLAARVYTLLTNRLHPIAVEGFDMNALRRRFHSLASAI